MIDTVVLWDWIISLPREWQYVRAPSLTQLAHSDVLQIWKTPWTPVKVAYLFCRSVSSKIDPISHLSIYRYWVITVVPYLLYAFVINHSLETCQKIYKVGPASNAEFLTVVTSIRSPWHWLCGTKLVRSVRCHPRRQYRSNTKHIIYVAVLLIRTYAFFNRNKLVLAGLLCALGGMVAYQLYVDTSQMLGKCRRIVRQVSS